MTHESGEDLSAGCGLAQQRPECAVAAHGVGARRSAPWGSLVGCEGMQRNAEREWRGVPATHTPYHFSKTTPVGILRTVASQRPSARLGGGDRGPCPTGALPAFRSCPPSFLPSQTPGGERSPRPWGQSPFAWCSRQVPPPPPAPSSKNPQLAESLAGKDTRPPGSCAVAQASLRARPGSR